MILLNYHIEDTMFHAIATLVFITYSHCSIVGFKLVSVECMELKTLKKRQLLINDPSGVNLYAHNLPEKR